MNDQISPPDLVNGCSHAEIVSIFAAHIAVIELAKCGE